jgi:hypothetical protein
VSEDRNKTLIALLGLLSGEIRGASDVPTTSEGLLSATIGVVERASTAASCSSMEAEDSLSVMISTRGGADASEPRALVVSSAIVVRNFTLN